MSNALTSPSTRQVPHLHVVPKDFDDSGPATVTFGMVPEPVFALGGEAIALYAVLAKHANKDGECWPSMKTICETLGWSPTRTRPALAKLLKAGVVEKQERKLHGMDQANLYRLTLHKKTANGQVVRSELPVVHGEPMGSSPRTLGSITTNHELDSIELDTEELEREGDEPQEPAQAEQPLPQNGDAQKIVAAYCEAAGIKRPANYGKAVGQAADLLKTGVRPEDVPSLFDHARSWTRDGTANLGTMLSSVESWQQRQNGRANPSSGNGERLPYNSAKRFRTGAGGGHVG